MYYSHHVDGMPNYIWDIFYLMYWFPLLDTVDEGYLPNYKLGYSLI